MNRSFLLILPLALACRKEEPQSITIRTAPVTRRTIELDVTASGAVEPINVVEVKSKSSGQIVQMTVETGSQVSRGELLVQLETRDVQNQFDQSQADLNAAEERLRVSEAQKKRADDLFEQRITTATEHEAALIDYANARAAVIRARTSLDLAQQRLDDATVRAPGVGTIIEKTVSLGQVITSATSAFGGGTTLLKMADLTKVRMRALFNETDIGSVKPGQTATVTVDAFPDRPFTGLVEKIEPQAVIQQSVTMFPVLINLQNREGLLRPGMNGEASVLVDRRENVLSVPNDAIRTSREAPMLAGALGLDADSVGAQIQAQLAQFGGMRRSRRAGEEAGLPNVGGGPGGPPRGMRLMQGEVDLTQDPQRQRPPVDSAACAKLRTAMAAKPEVARQLQTLRQRMANGEIDFTAMREESAKLYGELGVDAASARGCMGGGGGGGRGPGGPPDAGAGGTRSTAPAAGAAGAAQQTQQSGRGTTDRPQGGTGRGAPTQGATQEGRGSPEAAASQGGAGGRTAVVFVVTNGSYTPKVVRLGAANFDYTEVISGLQEGDEVALLATAAMQAARDSSNARFRQMTGGGGMPGMTRQGGGTPAGGGGGSPRP